MMEGKEKLYIIGALASIVALILIFRKRDSIVQAPNIGRVGTAPGVDTTPQELAFKSSIFSTYANYLGLQDSNKTALDKLKIQSTSAEGLARLAAENSQNLAVIGGQNNSGLAVIQGDYATRLAQINADSDLAKTNILASSANAGELLRLQYQNDAIRRQQSTQARQSTLDSILKGLSGLLGGSQQRPSGSGSAGGGSSNPRSPDYNPNARRPTTSTSAAARNRVQQALNAIRINNYNSPLSFLDYPPLGDAAYMNVPDLPNFGFDWPNYFNDFGYGDLFSDYPTLSFPGGDSLVGEGSFPEFSWDVDSYGGWDNFPTYFDDYSEWEQYYA